MKINFYRSLTQKDQADDVEEEDKSTVLGKQTGQSEEDHAAKGDREAEEESERQHRAAGTLRLEFWSRQLEAIQYYFIKTWNSRQEVYAYH